jgi:hypothetical protein
MAITGIPPYATPIEQSLRCTCGARFVVYLGGGMGDAEGRAQERAAALKAQYVNTQLQSWLVCGCGQLLEFLPEASHTIQ